MNYATQHHIGNNQPTRKKTTKSAVPTIEPVRRLDAKTKGCKRNSERQTEISADRNVAYGFLTCKFLPKLKTESAQATAKTIKMERDVYQSLSQLAKHYGIEPMQTNQFEYPYNIALTLWDIEEKLNRININWDSLRLVQDNKKTYFISEERYNTDMTLYYIPIVPLYQMLKDPKRKKTAQLLVSICSYLYHIAGIPYYRQEYSYLFEMYEIQEEWMEQDETEETETNRRELRTAELIGDYMEQKLFNRINLQLFEQRLNRLECSDTFDIKCRQVACNAFTLFTDYPSESIFRNALIPEYDTYSNDFGNDYDHEAIGMEKYISFVADTKGWLAESIIESINNEFNEYGIMEEPGICKIFNGSEITVTNLDFENRLFAVLEHLRTILQDYKTTKK